MIITSPDQVPRATLLKRFPVPRNFGVAPEERIALSRGDNEGGAGPSPQESLVSDETQSDIPELTNAELVQLRIRVIALENLGIALLAEASERQLDLAREMAAYISPRRGFTITR